MSKPVTFTEDKIFGICSDKRLISKQGENYP